MKKIFRIKKNEAIKAVMDHRDIRKDGFFSVYKKKSDRPHFRYAISVPAKYGTAARRIRIKRQLRMIIKECDIQVPVDLFIIVHKKASTLDFWQQRHRVRTLLKKHGINIKNS